MAKRDEFPQSTHIIPRLQAIIEALSACRGALKSVQEHALARLPEPLRQMLGEHIRGALAIAERASEAITGEGK